MSLPRCVLKGTTYLVTRRCLGRRFLLRPDRLMNDLFRYCLARAAEAHGIELHAVTVMSNHYHLVLTDIRGVLPDFMRALNRQVAMGVKRLRDWDEVVWEPNVPYSAVALESPREVLDKVAYTLLNPVSAGLVRRSERFPGLVSTLARLREGRLHAQRPNVWFSKTAPKRATLRFCVPPGFSDQAQYFQALKALLQSRLRTLRAEHSRRGREYLGRAAILRTQVTASPNTKKQRFGRRPAFSALTRERWKRALQLLRGFRRAYRAAYEAWRSGDRSVVFPRGSWWVVRFGGAQASP
jgi:REP element-mobilizing transposase RayT